jgi:hypothetical protein
MKYSYWISLWMINGSDKIYWFKTHIPYYLSNFDINCIIFKNVENFKNKKMKENIEYFILWNEIFKIN